MEMAFRAMSLVLVISMGCLCSSQAYTFYVGGHDGWIPRPGHTSYNRWAETNRFQINDTIVFKYKKGSDSVLVVTKDDYERCNKDSPLQVFKDGDSKFEFRKSGPFFFISGRTQHCEKGQKLVTVVLSDRHHNAPPPTQAPPIKPPSSHSPAPQSHKAPPPHPSPPTTSHHAPAPTPHPTHAPPRKPPQPSPAPKSSSHQVPSHSPSPAPHQAPPVTPSQSPSPKAESPINDGDAPRSYDAEDHPPAPHARSPSAAPRFGASLSLLAGTFSLAIFSLLSAGFV